VIASRPTPKPHRRQVRSFVKRPGRITAAQKRALVDLLPHYGIAFRQGPLDLDEIYGRAAPRVLDIGFGNGEALLSTAAHNPGIDFLGVEVHEPGIGHLLVLLERAGIGNVRIVDRDAVDVLAAMIPDASFAAVNLFFPDPWPKKRHHKRRLVQPGFVAEIARVLEHGGMFHIATDWASYAEHCRTVMSQVRQFCAVDGNDLCNNPLAYRPPSKFERRGLRLGHVSEDLYYVKRRAPAG
jgi:tRNA (guanine-N7-)-methyltransferase